MTPITHAHALETSDILRQLRPDIDLAMTADVNVLVTDRNGGVKEAVACAVHSESLRRGRPFIAVNCAGLPEERLQAELFGQESSTIGGRPGAIEAAQGGTLFLDEISRMGHQTQQILLRFMDTSQFRRPRLLLRSVESGQIRPRRLPRAEHGWCVRIVAATSIDLSKEVAAGRFDGRLFYRLNVVHVMNPVLRERTIGIPMSVPVSA